MLLIGVNRSPFTRRVAITLNIYGVPFEQHALSGFDNRAEVRASNPLGRIPALVLDSGETLIDSNAIIDHLDLRRPIYKDTAAYGHFGRSGPSFTWERTDRADVLRKAAGLGAVATVEAAAHR